MVPVVKNGKNGALCVFPAWSIGLLHSLYLSFPRSSCQTKKVWSTVDDGVLVVCIGIRGADGTTSLLQTSDFQGEIALCSFLFCHLLHDDLFCCLCQKHRANYNMCRSGVNCCHLLCNFVFPVRCNRFEDVELCWCQLRKGRPTHIIKHSYCINVCCIGFMKWKNNIYTI